MRESYFQGEWIKSWRHHYPKCHIVKIPDMPKTAGSRFLPPKPYDFYAILDGKTYAMELKLKTKLGGFAFDDVTEWQVNNLLEAQVNGALAYIVINYRVSGITPRQQKGNGLVVKRINRVFIIDIRDFVALDKSLNSRSIPFKTLLGHMGHENGFYQIEKNGDHWDVPKMGENSHE